MICLLSLWLGFSGCAEKINYEFEDICPHGPDRRTAACSNLLNTTGTMRAVFSMLKLLQLAVVFSFGGFSALTYHHIYVSWWNCSRLYLRLSRCLLMHAAFFLPLPHLACSNDRERSHPLISFSSVAWCIYRGITIGVGVVVLAC